MNRLLSFVLVISVFIFSSCCLEVKRDFSTRFETPQGYDLLNTRIIGTNELTYTDIATRLFSSGQLTHDKLNGFVIKDTNSLSNFKLISGYFSDVDWTTEDVIMADFGGVNEVNDAHLEYRVFVNHKLEEIMIGSRLESFTGCFGTGITGFSFKYVLVVPEIPEGYGLNFNPEE
ncbi:MAG: hypothetical protein H6608_01575 [Flavobacteriales bacterium]|nr:hypothetical protein [Bacteroidota bacterium]MCB9239796.1 hypothetical protein [Flavobacteriales bacterium]